MAENTAYFFLTVMLHIIDIQRPTLLLLELTKTFKSLYKKNENFLDRYCIFVLNNTKYINARCTSTVRSYDMK